MICCLAVPMHVKILAVDAPWQDPPRRTLLQEYLPEGFTLVIPDAFDRETVMPGQKSASIMLDQWHFRTIPLALPVKARVVGG